MCKIFLSQGEVGMNLRLLAVLGMVVAFEGPAFAQGAPPNACSPVMKSIENKMTPIKDKYKKKFDDFALQQSQRANKIKDDAPKPSTAEAAVNFKIDVKMKDREIKIDLPEFTMRTKTISFDLPEIENRRREISWKNPTLVMKQRCVEGIPETVCGSYKDSFGISWPKCGLRKGPDICTDVPTMEQRDERIVFDVPTIVMKRQDVKLDLPEMKMKTQRIVFGIPEITIKDVQGEIRKTKQESDKLKKDSDQTQKVYSSAMRNEFAQVIKESAPLMEKCAGEEVETGVKSAVASIDKGIGELQTALAAAAKAGARAYLPEMQRKIAELTKQKAFLLSQIEKKKEEARAGVRKALQQSVS
jgi:hypothetical protein